MEITSFQWRELWRAAKQPFTGNYQSTWGIILSTLVLTITLLGPFFAPHAAQEMLGTRYGAPDANAWLGYDYLGQDVFSRVLLGGRSLVWMSLLSSALALLIGASIGLWAGFIRGRVEQSVIWLSDVLIAFPNLILILLVVTLLGRDKWLIVLAVTVTFLPGVIRLSRGLSQSIAQQEFVEAAFLLGFPLQRILIREILPNILTPLMIHLGTMFSWAVGLLSGLSFLGYGVAPPEADWGLMVNENRGGLQVQPYAVLVPVVLIGLFALGANLLSEGMARRVSRIGERT